LGCCRIESSPSLRPREPGVVCLGTHHLPTILVIGFLRPLDGWATKPKALYAPDPTRLVLGRGGSARESAQHPFIRISEPGSHHPGFIPTHSPAPPKPGWGGSTRGLRLIVDDLYFVLSQFICNPLKAFVYEGDVGCPHWSFCGSGDSTNDLCCHHCGEVLLGYAPCL